MDLTQPGTKEKGERNHMSEARKNLKAAIEHTARAAEQIKSLTSTVAQADAMLQDAQRELEIFADLETKIARWRAGELKAGRNARHLPEDLKAMTERKRLAEEELERAQNTRGALVDELEEAKRQLHPAEAAKMHCAVRVLREEKIDSAARELTKLNIRRAELQQLIEGFQGMDFLVNGVPHMPEISKDVSAAMLELEPESLGARDTRDGMAERWKSRLKSLLADPDVVLSTPKEVRLTDYVESTPKFEPGKPFPQTVTYLRAES
jgi:DNA repair exonuclease SbcCD ATPase subunit